LFQEKDDFSIGSRRILFWHIGLLKTEGQSLIKVTMRKQNNKKTKKDIIACDQILSRDSMFREQFQKDGGSSQRFNGSLLAIRGG